MGKLGCGENGIPEHLMTHCTIYSAVENSLAHLRDKHRNTMESSNSTFKYINQKLKAGTLTDTYVSMVRAALFVTVKMFINR